jgi:hypothetical protein
MAIACVASNHYYRMEGFLDERQRATNNNLQRLEIELIDIEESLRFAQRGPVNLREVPNNSYRTSTNV